jgi:murein DD-endopeptidase MepM/ murein hydrolase activator NlpD
MSELSIVLGAETPMDLTARLMTLSKWNANKQALISGLVKSKEDLSQQAKELATIESEKAKKKAASEAIVLDAKAAAAIAEAAQQKVNKIVAKKEASLKIAMKHRDSVKKRYSALKREQARLKKLAQNAGNIGKDLHDNDDLVWPVTGARVTQYTGPRIHPVYGYRSCHTGIDLGASSGTSIKSAEDGVVASVQNTDSGPYGKYTLISHGDGLSTFYAHQSSIQVQKGDSVKRGEVIGKVGSTGWSTGAHLHFEVRVKGTPYNPMCWFGGSKTKVSCVD